MAKKIIKSVLLSFPFLFGTAYGAMQTVTPGVTGPAPSIIPPPPSTASSSPSYTLIDPKMRAQDFKEAFEALRKEKTSAKVFFQLTNGSSVSNIIDMTLMTNATLILFRFNSTQGVQSQLVKVEEIASISYLQ